MDSSPSLFYAVMETLGAGQGFRVPRTIQRAAAQSLLENLTAAAGLSEAAGRASSKSHSRNLTAVALAARPGLRLGVDVEYDAPERPIAEIAAIFLGEAPAQLSARAFYRAWTAGEAWVKAFGGRPDVELLRRVLAEGSPDGRVYSLGEAAVMHDTPAPGFLLSLVWSPHDGYAPPARLFP
jgi:hypothetical protein